MAKGPDGSSELIMDPMSQQEYERMLQLGSENQQLQQQIEMAQAMGATPQMRNVGRISRAPNPLEYLAAALNQRVGRNAQNKQRSNTDLQNQMMLAALLRSQQPQAQAEPPAGNGMQAAPQTPYGQMRY